MFTSVLKLALATYVVGAISHTANAQQWAVRFSDAELVLPHHPVMNTDAEVTIEGWLRSFGETSGLFTMFERYKGSAEHKGVRLLENGAAQVIYAGSPWPEQSTSSEAVPRDGEWHHIAFVREASGAYALYVDGTSKLVGGPGPCWLTCNIINSNPATETFGEGWDVRSLRVSSVARYVSEFVPAGSWASDSATALLLTLEEGNGGVVSDSSSVGQSGTLTGAYEWVPVSLDCDGDGVSNSDEIAQGAPDCNANGIPDDCDIELGVSFDQDGNGIPDECSPPLLAGLPTVLDAFSGGTQHFTLTAGPESKLDLYFLLGSSSGTSPGFVLGDLTLPLNIFDPYFNFTIEQPNSAILVNTFGVLDIQGTATASVNVPPASQLPSLAGMTFHHAYIVLGGKDFSVSVVSNSVELSLLP